MRPPARSCPRCGQSLCGGPVLFTCQAGHATYAADLPTDFHPTTRSAS